jgi:DNA-binding NtrC family response regulator
MPDLTLVADADPGVNALVAHVLARAGYAVRRLPGPGAVTPAAAARCPLVVLGGGRSGARAVAAAAGLRQAGVGTPVLILANGHDPDAAGLAETDPTVRVLHKPVLPAKLADVVRELLGDNPAVVRGGTG